MRLARDLCLACLLDATAAQALPASDQPGPAPAQERKEAATRPLGLPISVEQIRRLMGKAIRDDPQAYAPKDNLAFGLKVRDLPELNLRRADLIARGLDESGAIGRIRSHTVDGSYKTLCRRPREDRLSGHAAGDLTGSRLRTAINIFASKPDPQADDRPRECRADPLPWSRDGSRRPPRAEASERGLETR